MIVFFDIDETLLNQRGAEAAALSRFVENFRDRLPPYRSLPEFCTVWRSLRERHSPVFLHGRIGVHEYRRRRIRELFADTEPLLSDREADARFDLYEQEYRRSWRLFDDVIPCLQSLAGVSVGIISNGSHEQQHAKLIRTAIAGRFEVVVISEELAVPKPQPHIFLEACRRAGAHPSECVHVGDKLHSDARGSRGAGMRGIWLDRHNAAADLNGHCDVEIVRDLHELCALLRTDPMRPPFESAAMPCWRPALLESSL